MTRRTKDNPFGLTFRQYEVMEELIRLGSAKAVAASEGCNPKTVRNLMRVATKKIGAKTTLQAAVEFDRKRRVPFEGQRPASSVFDLSA